jgi:hypothetical protein
MEISKKTRVALGFVIIGALSFSRVTGLSDIRSVDALMLVVGGASLGALIALLILKKN